MITEPDYIHLEDLVNLCPQRYDPAVEPFPGLLFCEPELVKDLFAKYTRWPYILVSCASDATIVLQKEATVNADSLWYKAVLDQVALLPPEEKYNYVQFPPRCDLQKCSHRDKYSVKYAHYTQSTFNEIPDNIKRWYVTNCMIVGDERIVGIPFGIAKQAGAYKYNTSKTKLLYVNFQNFSHLEREKLNSFWNSKSWVTHKENVPYEEYKKDLSEHMFVLSPPGNGMDCFRTWESIYCGSVPIVLRNKWYEHFQDLPMLPVSDMYGLTPRWLYSMWDAMAKWDTSLDKAKLSYWKERILRDDMEIAT
jgi:hypothetical protein